MSDKPFLSRVYDAKHRFEQQHDMIPTQLFLGPAQTLELYDYIKELERDGFIVHDSVARHSETLAGMTIIALASDGLRAGISEE